MTQEKLMWQDVLFTLAETSTVVEKALTLIGTAVLAIAATVLTAALHAWRKKKADDAPSSTGDKKVCSREVAAHLEGMRQQLNDHDMGALNRDSAMAQATTKNTEAIAELAKAQVLMVERLGNLMAMLNKR